MAAIAVGNGMRTQQWKTVLVCTNRFHSRLPSNHCVATLTIRPKLTAMEIGVAILALFTHVDKILVDMTGSAWNILVQPTQRITSFCIVAEFWRGFDRVPA